MTTSARLEQEAHATRAGLSKTIDELRNSVTTTALTNGAMTFAKEGSATLAKAAVDRAAASPLAAMLIGAGILLMMSNKGSSEIVDKVNSTIKSAASAVTGAATGTAEGAVSATRSASGSVSHAASDAAGYVTDTAKNAMDQASAGLDKAKDMVAEGQQRATETLHDAQDFVAHTTDRFAKFAEEQPILVAALGMALGAALGSSLPLTEAEKHYLGEAGAAVAKKGEALALDVADTVTDQLAGADVSAKVGEVADAVTRSVKGALS